MQSYRNSILPESRACPGVPYGSVLFTSALEHLFRREDRLWNDTSTHRPEGAVARYEVFVLVYFQLTAVGVRGGYMKAKVTGIISGNTIRVSPLWSLNGRKGDIVRIRGYNTPEVFEPGFEEAKDRLSYIVMGKEVELNGFKAVVSGFLICDVLKNGRHLKDNFPEYQ